MHHPTLRRGFAAIAAAAAFTLFQPLAARAADVKWDVSLPWGPTEFHSTNAQKFAEEVKAVTGGAVQMTIHTGGALGIKANESLRAVEDGAVPMAEYAAFQNVGEIPLLGVESIPFLISDYGDLAALMKVVRPVWEAELEKRGQKVLYVVPWPSQNFFTKTPVATLDDLKGVRMRTYDRVTADMVTRLGMVALQMNNPDIVPALASGKLDAVMTSGTTAVAQKYWEFLKHAYNTNHMWASNLMVVNLDEWNRLDPKQQKMIEATAHKLEPQFWEISKAEHAKRMDELRANGMTVEPASDALKAAMREATASMEGEFVKANPAAAPLLDAYHKAVGH